MQQKKLFITFAPILLTTVLLGTQFISSISTRVTTDYVVAREQANDNAFGVKLFKKDTPYSLLSTSGNWSYVHIDNQNYYIPTADLNGKTVNASQQAKQRTVNTPDAPIFSDDALQRQVGDLDQGNSYLQYASQNNISQLVFEDQLVFIDNSKLADSVATSSKTSGQTTNGVTYVTTNDFPETDILTVTSDWTGLFAQPGGGGKLTDYLTDSFLYFQQDHDDNFVFAKDTEGLEGYISTKFVKREKLKQRIGNGATSLNGAKIVLDVGHGGVDGGGVSPDKNITESKMALETSLVIKDYLEKSGATVIMTRNGDDNVSLEERADLANIEKPDVFLSIHYDASGDTSLGLSGTSVHVLHYSDQLLASIMEKSLAELPLKSNGVKQNNFYVLREHDYPSLLLELGYIDNDKDIAVFNSDDYRHQVANRVQMALENYFAYAK